LCSLPFLFICRVTVMDGLKDVIKLKSILKKETTEVRDGVNYGMYSHIGQIGNRMVQMKWQDTLRNWYLPFGVPYTVQTGDANGLKKKYIAYKIGDELFVHKYLYDKYVGNMNATILTIPVAEETTSLSRSGWLTEEKELYERMLWRLAVRSSGSDFQKISRINFEAQTNIDKDLLARDGWVVNKILGSNAFYGIYQGKTKKQGDNKIYWFNRYIVLVDLVSGSGITVDGLMKWGRNPHPHVHPDLRLCFGGYERHLYDHINKGEITSFYMLMKHFLSQYNPDSPTFRLPLDRSDRSNLSGLASKYFSKYIYFK
jgi:hypothetical protein